VYPISLAKWQTDIETWMVCLMFTVLWQLDIHHSVAMNTMGSFSPFKSFTVLLPVFRFGFLLAVPYFIVVFVTTIIKIQLILKGEIKPLSPEMNSVESDVQNSVESVFPENNSAELKNTRPPVPQKSISFHPSTKKPAPLSRSRAIDIFTRYDPVTVNHPIQRTHVNQARQVIEDPVVTAENVRLGNGGLRSLYA